MLLPAFPMLLLLLSWKLLLFPPKRELEEVGYGGVLMWFIPLWVLPLVLIEGFWCLRCIMLICAFLCSVCNASIINELHDYCDKFKKYYSEFWKCFKFKAWTRIFWYIDLICHRNTHQSLKICQIHYQISDINLIKLSDSPTTFPSLLKSWINLFEL